MLIDESKTICPYKVTNDNDHNAFIFSIHMKINKKITIVIKIKRNGDLLKRDLKI